MAEFAPNFTVVQSPDAGTLTITDTSNYDVNDELYSRTTFQVRNFQIYDYLGELIQETDIPDSGAQMDIVTYTLPQAAYLSIRLNLQKTDAPTASYEKILNSSYVAHLQICFANRVVEDDCCGDCACDTNMKILQAIETAQILGLYSMPLQAQTQIDFANDICSSENGNCSC